MYNITKQSEKLNIAIEMLQDFDKVKVVSPAFLLSV